MPPFFRILEVERGGEVSHNGAAPGSDIGLDQVVVAAAEPRLEEFDHRRVIEQLPADQSSLAPRRDNNHRDGFAETERSCLEHGAVRRRRAWENFVDRRYRRTTMCG